MDSNNIEELLLPSLIPQMIQPQSQPFFTQEQYQQIVQMLYKGSSEGSSSSCKIAIVGILNRVNAFVSQLVNSDWITDIGASKHITTRLESLHHHKSLPNSEKNIVHFLNGNVMSITHIGSTYVLNS